MGKAKRIKKLRRIAEKLAKGTESDLKVKLRKVLFKDKDGTIKSKDALGTAKYTETSFKSIYKKLKKSDLYSYVQNAKIQPQ